MRRALLLALAVLVGFAAGIATQRAMVSRGGATTPHGGTSATPSETQLWTCSMHPQVIQDRPGMCPICHMELTPLKPSTPGKVDQAGTGAVTIDPSVMQNMGIRTAVARIGRVHRVVRAAGTLDEAEPNLRDITARVSGWVTRLHASTEGVHVHKGDPLFELTSPELQVAVDELVATSGEGDLHDLARRKLVLFGVDEEEIDRLAAMERAPSAVVFRSPISGDVVEKLLVEGSAISPGDRLFRIVDHGTLWIHARVFERDLPFVKVGSPARANVPSRPGERFEGRVLFIHPHVDVATRAAIVRLAVPNAGGTLKPGMEANVEIEGDAGKPSVLAPRQAILDTGTRQVAFVSLGEGRFDPRDVVMGLEGEDGWTEILQGIAEGEAVVTSGQFLLDSESRLREAIEQYRGGTPHSHGASAESAKAARTIEGGVDPLVRQYLAISAQLGAVETNARAVDPAPLVEAAAALARDSSAGERDLALRAQEAASALANEPLAMQRELFKGVSDAVIALVQARPPSRDVSDQLYVMDCPMAPGRWLQREKKLANPYYASTMKQCGTIVATIPALDPQR